MDLALELADEYLLDSVWARLLPAPGTLQDFSATNVTSSTIESAWPRDYFPRQLASLTVMTLVGIHLLYFIFASFSYYFIFNHDMMRHPRFLKNQVRLEIICSLKAFPMITALTLPWFIGEVRGHSKLYQNVDEYGVPWLIFSMGLYVSSQHHITCELDC